MTQAQQRATAAFWLTANGMRAAHQDGMTCRLEAAAGVLPLPLSLSFSLVLAVGCTSTGGGPTTTTDAAPDQTLTCAAGCLCFNTPDSCAAAACTLASVLEPDGSTAFLCGNAPLGFACQGHHGQCLPAGATCLNPATPEQVGTYDCDPWPSTGAFCCLDQADAGDGGGMQDADAAASEDGPDAGSCPETIDTYCAADASSCAGCRCVPDWSTAKDPSQWCLPSTPSDRVFVYPQCDGFNLVVVGYADTSTFYYYDPMTLRLVRVEDHGIGGALCVAGQAGSVVPLTDCLDGAAPTSVCTGDATAD
jgi:hypothetical protein